MKAIGGICGPCKIVYDQWYKNRQKAVSLIGYISVVSVRADLNVVTRLSLVHLVFLDGKET